jgi:hypothetical protein
VSTQRIYALPVEQTEWRLGSSAEVVFNWEYDEGRDQLLTLYSKGKQKQWDAESRIDWSLEVDPENPSQMPDEVNIGFYGSETWERMTEAERVELRYHVEAWRASQFLHGEQGALICAAKIVETVPDIDSKFYAATQVIDEARHVEVYSRFLHSKIGFAYPANGYLKTLLEQVITDSRWDFTYLGMQVLIEGLALAAFGIVRDHAQNPLASAINAYVMQDEARHVAFGRLALRDYYPQLTEAERDEREEFVIEACHLLRNRFQGDEVWVRLGLPVEECSDYMERRRVRKRLFTRIVPTIKDIGLWGDKVRLAFEEMGVMDFASLDPDEASAADETIADSFDARRAQVDATIAAGSGSSPGSSPD